MWLGKSEAVDFVCDEELVFVATSIGNDSLELDLIG